MKKMKRDSQREEGDIYTKFWGWRERMGVYVYVGFLDLYAKVFSREGRRQPGKGNPGNYHSIYSKSKRECAGNVVI